jgi:transposase
MVKEEQPTEGSRPPRQLNRKQRRKLQRQLKSNDPGLTVVNPNAAGIDVGNENHYVAVPPDRDPEPVQMFGSCTGELRRLAEWLVRCRIDTVALQATGVYWFTLFTILTGKGIKVTVVNAIYTKNVPGRKSDVQECQWLMKLHTYGLLADSFHLPQWMEKVRTVWRVRANHVEAASRAVQHMQKALTKMNVQLANAISDISGVSGQAIVQAILGGERDPYRLADLRDKRVKATREEVARSLEGLWREDLLFELQQAVDSYDFTQQQMEVCDRKLQVYLAELPARPLPCPGQARRAEPVGPAQQAARRKARRKAKPKGNAPKFDLQTELTRIAGVDLTSIDGISLMTAQTILAEVGPDLSAFPDEDHFASWLGLCPNKDITGGKVIRRARKKVRNRVAEALRTAASTLKESHSYLGAKYRHFKRQLPAKTSAVKAMAHYLAVLVYRLLTHGQAWVDQGEAQHQHQREERELARLHARAAAKGLKLVPMQA